MKRRIHPKAEPFWFAGDGIGCLLTHGFTGAPAEVKLLGEHLAGQGRTVFGPRLFGHGTDEADLDRAQYQDWLASAEDGYHLLRQTCDRVFLAGLSMGAAISLSLASHLPVDGVIGLSTAYKLPDDPRVPFIRPLSLFWRRLTKGDSDWHDPSGQQLHYSYPAYPVPAVAELVDLLADMRRSLSQIQAPVLLMQSKQDGSMAVPADAMPSIAQALARTEVETHWLENSGHVITLDAEREQVFQTVSQFIDRIVNTNSPVIAEREG